MPTKAAPPAKKAATAARPKQARVSRSAKKSSPPTCKRYVLDTNVLLHDPTAIFRFQENDIYLPLVVLEELDRHKKGTADIARNARQVTRLLDQLLHWGSMAAGFDLTEVSSGLATGRLYFRGVEDEGAQPTLPSLDHDKADNQILACAMALLKTGSGILVTKDINLRVKALACDVPAQDYRNDKVLLSDSDMLPTGYLAVDGDFWARYQTEASSTCFRLAGRQCARIELSLPVNTYLMEDLGKDRARLWRVLSNTPETSVVGLVEHGAAAAHPPLLEPRNNEQRMAWDLLHDKDIDFAALVGIAGTGKTLMAVAAGLEQVRKGLYQEVLVTRATVPMGEEIGFLPGTEQEKMDPWLGGTLRDVFAALKLSDPKSPLRQSVEVASMSFMRGRSFHRKYIVIDEAQNLTASQMRSLLTRAGEGSKVIITGNLAQIDTPYLDEGSSGLAWAVKTMQGWTHGGHIILPRGERSRLATYVEEMSEQADGA